MRSATNQQGGRSGRAARLWPCAAASLLVCLASMPVGAQAPARAVARLAVAENGAQIRRGSDAWADAVPGEEIWTGDRLRTLGLAFARLDFPGGGVRLAGGAELELNAGPKPGEPLVVVQSGEAIVFLDRPEAGRAAPQVALELGAGSRGVLEARGEKPVQVRVSLAESRLLIAALQGDAALLATGKETVLPAGHAAEVLAGEARDVRALTPAPAPRAPGLDDRFFCPGLVARLVWQPLPGASGYRVQVAADPGFQTVVLDAETKADHTLFVPRAAATYSWRVAARGADGRLGDFGAPRPIFCEDGLPADLLESPSENAAFRSFGKPPSVLFQWKPWPGAASYRLVVARGDDLRAPNAVTKTTTGTSLELSELTEGEYVWGVWVDEVNGPPLFLAPRHFAVKRSTVKVPVTLQQWGG